MTNNMIIAADALARKRIIEETGTSFFVEAGAGSGKTTSLVARMVSMIAAGIDIRGIAAITYTKAAAREFYMRFQRELDKARRNAKSDELRERFTKALLDIDLCFMGTIDAFCNLILHEYPVEAGLPMDAAIFADDELMHAYKAEWLLMKRGVYGKELQALYMEFAQFHTDGDAVFKCCIASFMSTRANERPYLPYVSIDINTTFNGERDDLMNISSCILANPQAQKKKRDGSDTDSIAVLKARADVFSSTWSDNISRVISLMEKIDGLRLLRDPEDIGIRCKDYFIYSDGNKREYILSIKTCPAYMKLKELQYSVTLELMDKFSRAVADKLKASGKLDFFDYILYLRDLLRDDAKTGGVLIKHIQKRYGHFLIDEFQDTNPLQAEIFFYLTAKTPCENWRECVPQPGSLFIVGDPKQSIYRFQGADVSAFLRVRELFTGEVGDVVKLYRNYRSCNALISWFNDIFLSMLPETSQRQSAFEAIPKNERAEAEGSICGTYRYYSDRESDPALCAQLVKNLILDENMTVAVYENGRNVVRRIRYDDIMLITRTKTHIADYINEFAARGIPFMVEGKTSFSECEPLTTLSAIISALAAPLDSIAVYAALKCGVFDISDDDILAWRSTGRRLSLYESEGEGAVREALSKLSGMLREIGELTPSAAAQSVCKSADILAICGKNRLEYYFYALELLRQAEIAGEIFSLEGTAAFFKELLSDSRERELSLVKKAGGVHIANLHKVKGLEAPIVILATPDKRTRSADLSTVYTDKGAKTIYFSIAKRGGRTYAATATQSDAKAFENAQLEAEELRLKYVAATRAGSALIVSTLEKIEAKSNLWREFAMRIHSELPLELTEDEAMLTIKTADIALMRTEAHEYQAALRDVSVPSYKISRPSMLKVKSKTSSEDEYDDMIASDIEAASRKRHAALIGTLIHRMMELVVLSKGALSAENVTKNIAAEFELFGDTGDEILKIVGDAAKRIKSGGYPQKNGLPQDLLKALDSAEEVMCETPVCMLIDEPQYMLDDRPTLLHGIIDLAYKKDGEWHIVDYKTSIDPSDLDAHYMNQLDSYAYAFEKATGFKADARVYHIEV